MTDDADGVDEAFEGLLRVGLTAAGRAAEILAREREEHAREAQTTTVEHVRDLAERLQAERFAVHAHLAVIERAEWWDQAQPEDIAGVWQVARAWEAHDQDAARAVSTIKDRVRERYDIDITAPAGDAAAVHAALERRGLAMEEADDERRRARADQVEAGQLLLEADRADRADRASSSPGEDRDVEGSARDHYDTADRRHELAASLDAVADEETTQARIVSDISQARPAPEAVRGSPVHGNEHGRSSGHQRRRTMIRPRGGEINRT